jgi:hypothetical protein
MVGTTSAGDLTRFMSTFTTGIEPIVDAPPELIAAQEAAS